MAEPDLGRLLGGECHTVGQRGSYGSSCASARWYEPVLGLGKLDPAARRAAATFDSLRSPEAAAPGKLLPREFLGERPRR
jgi:hypothetical protein